MSFNKKYSEILSVVREDIELVKEGLTAGIEVFEPLREKLFELLNAPSKHIRPLVSFLYLKAGGSEITSDQIRFQTAIELVHNASLIHDDIIDESAQRRGISTINKDFGNKLAVISGDYLLSVALKKVLDVNRYELVDMLCDTLKTMTSGEVDQHFKKFTIPSIDEYIEKSYKKTAKLFETAVCGSVFIRNPKIYSTDEMHKTFAKNFGIAFQIRDDLINCKTVKTDIKDGIYTAPVIFSGSLEITDKGIEKTEILLDNYIQNALKSIEKFDNSVYKEALAELIELLNKDI